MPDWFFDSSLVERPRSSETTRVRDHHQALRSLIGRLLYSMLTVLWLMIARSVRTRCYIETPLTWLGTGETGPSYREAA